MPGSLGVVEMHPVAPHVPGPVPSDASAAPLVEAAGSATRLRAWAPLVAVLALAAPPLFAHLGEPALWEDEGDTAVFARAIVRSGLPVAWDGQTLSDSDFGGRLVRFGGELVMVGTPWLCYYATAASFALFGETRAAARLPFALAGLATVALLYTGVRRVTGDRRAALAAALLLASSAQFLLFTRDSRHYALNMLLTLAVLGAFLRLRERPRSPWFAASAVLLFHAQILPALACVAACGALATLHPGFRDLRRPFAASLPWIAAGTVPWLWISWRETGENWTALGALAELPARTSQLGLESLVAVPWLGWAAFLPLVRRRLGPGDRRLLALAAAFVAAVFALAPLALSSTLLSVLGLRYVCGLLPVAAGASGVLVARASGGSRALLAAGIALFGLTHLAGGALPWLALGESRTLGSRVYANVPRETSWKLWNLELWALLRGLGRPDPGTAARLAGWLREHAAPGEPFVTNYSWDNVAFETGLPVRMLVSDDAPVRAAARAAGIPETAFSLDGVAWVVWRHGLPGLQGWTLPRIRAELAAQGAALTARARFPETQWENRPELAWHRFPGVGYPFAPGRLGSAGMRYRDAVIYRVVRPARAEPSTPPERAAEGAP